jgi:hypothetical protein
MKESAINAMGIKYMLNYNLIIYNHNKRLKVTTGRN